jgi:radical SAM protein with 4Fe4S-binding SPASM domain
LLDLLHLGEPRPHRSDLVRKPRDCLLRTRAFLEIGHIESFEVSADALSDLLHAALELAAREIAVPRIDGLKLSSVDRSHGILEHADVDAEPDEPRADRLDRRAVVLAKVGDRLDINLFSATRERLRGILAIDFVVPDYYAVTPKACMEGWGRRYLVMTPSGQILPCHAAPSIPGLVFASIREQSLRDARFHGAAFSAFRRTSWMKEPCRSCPRQHVDFGGCRCQALALTGAAQNADPVCEKSASHLLVADIVNRESGNGEAVRAYRAYNRQP